MIFYFLFIVTSVILYVRTRSGRKISRPIALLLALNIVLLTLYYFVNALSGNGFDESVVYHLAMGLKGAGLLAFSPLILLALGAIAASILGAFYMSGPSFNQFRSRDYVAVSATLGFALIAALMSNPLVLNVRSQLPLLKAAVFQHDNLDEEISKFRNTSIGSLINTKLSVQSPRSISAPVAVDSRNVIWIYAESLERTYFNNEVFDGLLLNLTEQEHVARRYTSVRQPWGTGWTIGGIVGSQCGVPLVTLGAKNVNSLTELPDFMPGTVCFGDLLSELGYSVEFVGGASKEFAGKGNFLATHGFAKIQDRATLREDYDNGSIERNEWGYYDDLLLSVLKQRATSLHAAEKPFFLNALTLDTHSPHGFVSPVCRSKVELAHNTEVGSAIKCSDYLLADFINWFRNSELSSDTILVISSDHLSMPNDLQSRIDSVSNERKLLFWMLGSDIEPGVVDKPASTFDIGATVLASVLPNTDVSIGLGRDIERSSSLYGSEFNNEDLTNNVAGFQALAWHHVSGSKSIFVNASTNTFLMNGRSYSFPVIVEFLDGEFRNVSWVEKARRESYVKLINDDSSYVWLDNCGWSPEHRFQGAVSFCAHIVKNGQIIDSIPFSNDSVTEIRAGQVSSLISQSIQSNSGSLRVRETNYALSVSGPGSKAGVIGPTSLAGSRGLNIYERDESRGVWRFVSNVDYCDGPNESDHFSDENYSPGKELLIVVKDTAHCGKVEKLEALAYSLGLAKLGSLQFRQPYIGIVGSDLTRSDEFVGEVGFPMIVALP